MLEQITVHANIDKHSNGNEYQPGDFITSKVCRSLTSSAWFHMLATKQKSRIPKILRDKTSIAIGQQKKLPEASGGLYI